MMILFINVVVTPSSFFMARFMDNNPLVVDHKLCLYSMPFFISRIEHLSSILVNRSWYLLFCAIYERYKSRKILFNFLWRFQPFSFVVYLLWNRQALSYQDFYLLDIPTDVALIKIKQKANQSVSNIEAIIY